MGNALGGVGLPTALECLMRPNEPTSPVNNRCRKATCFLLQKHQIMQKANTKPVSFLRPRGLPRGLPRGRMRDLPGDLVKLEKQVSFRHPLLYVEVDVKAEIEIENRAPPELQNLRA